MPRRNRVNFRAGAATERVTAMAGAQTTDELDVPASAVYRTLLAEALTGRDRDCDRGHQGPVKAAVCGHCGRTT